MIEYKILTNEAIAVIKPTGPLTEEDFAKLTNTVDQYLETHDALVGLLIHTQEFPGWEDLDGFIGHLKFVKDHHRKIKRVALASDSRMTSVAPKLASHFVSAEVKSFEYNSYEEALDWLRSERTAQGDTTD